MAKRGAYKQRQGRAKRARITYDKGTPDDGKMRRVLPHPLIGYRAFCYSFHVFFFFFFFFVLAIFASPVCIVMSDYYVTIMNEWNDLFLVDWANGYDLLNCCLSRSQFSNSRFNVSPQNMVCGRGSKVYGEIWTCGTCGDVQRTRKWEEISNPLSFRCNHQPFFFFCLFVDLTMGLLFIGCKRFFSQSRSAAIAIAYLLTTVLKSGLSM